MQFSFMFKNVDQLFQNFVNIQFKVIVFFSKKLHTEVFLRSPTPIQKKNKIKCKTLYSKHIISTSH